MKTNYQETVNLLSEMDEKQRQQELQNHWQIIFSDGFIGFVQGEMEVLRSQIAEADRIISQGGVEASVQNTLKRLSNLRLMYLERVWKSMVTVYQRLQKISATQGNSQGMTGNRSKAGMPRGAAVSPAASCFRCGETAVEQGLCGSCLSTRNQWEQDDLDHDQSLYDRQQDDLNYQRKRDDDLYYNNLPDFNDPW
jgi:soluble cytochrome b562